MKNYFTQELATYMDRKNEMIELLLDQAVELYDIKPEAFDTRVKKVCITSLDSYEESYQVDGIEVFKVRDKTEMRPGAAGSVLRLYVEVIDNRLTEKHHSVH